MDNHEIRCALDIPNLLDVDLPNSFDNVLKPVVCSNLIVYAMDLH